MSDSKEVRYFLQGCHAPWDDGKQRTPSDAALDVLYVLALSATTRATLLRLLQDGTRDMPELLSSQYRDTVGQWFTYPERVEGTVLARARDSRYGVGRLERSLNSYYSRVGVSAFVSGADLHALQLLNSGAHDGMRLANVHSARIRVLHGKQHVGYSSLEISCGDLLSGTAHQFDIAWNDLVRGRFDPFKGVSSSDKLFSMYMAAPVLKRGPPEGI